MFAGFAWFWLINEAKLVLSSIWKIAFIRAALFCIATVVAAAKERLKFYQIFSFIYKSLQRCWCLSETCGLKVCAAKQERFVLLKCL